MRRTLQYSRIDTLEDSWIAFTPPITFGSPTKIRELILPEKGDAFTTPGETFTYIVQADEVDDNIGWTIGETEGKEFSYVPVMSFPKDKGQDCFPTYIRLERFMELTFRDGQP